jgi:hypothetical protein
MRRISCSLSLAAILTPFFVVPAIDQTANLIRNSC